MLNLIKKILDYGLEKECGNEFDIPVELIKDLFKNKNITYYESKVAYFMDKIEGESTVGCRDTGLLLKIESLLQLEEDGKSVVDIALKNLDDTHQTIYEGENVEDGIVVVNDNQLWVLKSYPIWVDPSTLSGYQDVGSPLMGEAWAKFNECKDSSATFQDFLTKIENGDVAVFPNKEDFIKWYMTDYKVSTEEIIKIANYNVIDIHNGWTVLCETLFNNMEILESTHAVIVILR